ncbi:keratin-associated protein 29-1 [Rhynchocyon petersi]
MPFKLRYTEFVAPGKVSTSTMVDNCPGNTMSVPAGPTISMCPNRGRCRTAICLPSSCRSRTWQLVTCQENCQPSSDASGGHTAVSCLTTCLPSASCVGFACQPICSRRVGWESDTGQSTRLVSSCQPSCLETTDCQAQCCEASPCQQNSCQEAVCVSGSCLEAVGVSGSCQEACSQSVCHDTGSCQPSCTEVTSCPEVCPPAICVSSPCQPSCCQADPCHDASCEGQPCKTTYYQPMYYIMSSHFPCQSVPCVPVPCQPLTPMYAFSCNPSCSCQSLHCQPASSISFICQPVANCQVPCKSVPCDTMFSGQPTYRGPTSYNQCGCKSPSCQPACCVTGVGKSSSCFQAAPSSFCKASKCLPTSCQSNQESNLQKATLC